MTFILAMVRLGSAVHGKAVKAFAGMAIGGVVGLMVMLGGPIRGGLMSPARSFGPAIESGATENHWMYLIATVLSSSIYRM